MHYSRQGRPKTKAGDAAEKIAAYENRLTRIETDIALIKEMMATKTRALSLVIAQNFAILGGVAGLLKPLH